MAKKATIQKPINKTSSQKQAKQKKDIFEYGNEMSFGVKYGWIRASSVRSPDYGSRLHCVLYLPKTSPDEFVLKDLGSVDEIETTYGNVETSTSIDFDGNIDMRISPHDVDDGIECKIVFDYDEKMVKLICE